MIVVMKWKMLQKYFENGEVIYQNYKLAENGRKYGTRTIKVGTK